jgi:hypothetical protein
LLQQQQQHSLHRRKGKERKKMIKNSGDCYWNWWMAHLIIATLFLFFPFCRVLTYGLV